MDVPLTILTFVLFWYNMATFIIASLALVWSPIKSYMNWSKKQFLGTSVAETNAHGEDEEEFTSLYPDGLPGNKSGCLIVKPYFPIE